MDIGKLSTENLHRLINGNTGFRREEVVIRPKVGEDCAVIKVGDEGIILSTDPITGSENEIGKLAVHINCNDIASSGGEIIGLMMTILAPEGTRIEALETIMKEASNEAKKMNIEIIGGHTEITGAVNQILVSATAIGKEQLKHIVSTGGGRVGDAILITKGIGIEGTGIIAFEKEAELQRILMPAALEEAKGMLNKISVYKEGRLASKFGVTSMHDVTEGGVFGAIWETCMASGLGCDVAISKLPIAPVTRQICNYYGISPYQLISSGSMIITVVANRAEELVDYLAQNEVDAFVIGKLTDGDIRYSDEKGKYQRIPEPSSDELYKVI